MINLLPPEYKSEMKQAEYFRLLIIIGITLVAFVLVFSMLLISIRAYLTGATSLYEVQVMSITDKFAKEQETFQEIKGINLTVAEISSLYGKQIFISSILDEVGSLMVPDMYLTSFSYVPPTTIKRQEKTVNVPAIISVMGFAPTRDMLFTFRGDLQNNEMFQNISFPPTNWVDPIDVSFNFKAEITP